MKKITSIIILSLLCLTVKPQDGLIKSINAHQHQANFLALTPDGQSFVTSSPDKTIKYWNLQNWECTKTMEALKSEVTSLAFSPDGKLMAYGSIKEITIMNSENGEIIKKMPFKKITWVSGFSPDGKLLVLGNLHEILIIDATTYTELYKIKADPSTPFFVAFERDNKTMICTYQEDKKIRLYDTQTWQIKTEWKLPNSYSYLAYNSANKSFILGSPDKTVVLYDSLKQEIRKYNTVEKVHRVAFSPDSKYFATGDEKANFMLWSTESNNCLCVYKAAEKSYHQAGNLVFSKDGKQLYSTCYLDGKVKVWDATRREVYKIPEAKMPLVSKYVSDNTSLIMEVGKQIGTYKTTRITTDNDKRSVYVYDIFDMKKNKTASVKIEAPFATALRQQVTIRDSSDETIESNELYGVNQELLDKALNLLDQKGFIKRGE